LIIKYTDKVADDIEVVEFHRPTTPLTQFAQIPSFLHGRIGSHRGGKRSNRTCEPQIRQSREPGLAESVVLGRGIRENIAVSIALQKIINSRSNKRLKFL
jgi:hypothetical protein